MEMLFLSKGVEATRLSFTVKDQWRISVTRRCFNFVLFFVNRMEHVSDLVAGWMHN